MIEWTRVRELQDEVGVDDFEEVVEIFLEEVEDVVARLESTEDRSTLEQDLHFLKGSALSLGFCDLSAKCQSGETASAKGDAGSVDVPDIIGCYQASRESFVTGLKTLGAT